MITRLLLPVVSLGLLASGCGDDAIVVNDDGISSGGVKLDLVEPERGTILGGQNVLLQGEGLGGNNVVVAFGDMVADNVVVLSSEALLVVTPPGLAPGPTDVFVANAQGFAQRNAGWTYNDPPSVAAVSPAEGARAGGDEVTISGTGFQDNDAGTPKVFFDGEPATGVTVVSDTEITATTPPGFPLARADVQVSNVNGTGEADEAYLYLANGLFGTNPDPTACRGTNQHSLTKATLVFVDLDDNSVVDLGLNDSKGFVHITSDGEGTLVGLQACTNDLFEIDTTTGDISLLADVNATPSRRHLGGLVRDGNDYIVRAAPDATQFARLSTASGEVTQIGQPGGNPSVIASRGGIFADGNQFFWAGVVNAGGQSVNGVAEIDINTGAQVGDGIPLEFNLPIHSAALHRGEVFVGRRTDAGKGGSNNRAEELIRVDRATGELDFLLIIPIYVTSLASGDL